MAKRTRGSTRPGQRRPVKQGQAVRPETRPAVRPSGLTDEEEARAAELEARIVAEERAAEQVRTRSREAARVPEVERVARGKGQSLLAVRSAEEYGYVVRDVRRIVEVGGALLGVLVVLYVLLEVFHVVTVA